MTMDEIDFESDTFADIVAKDGRYDVRALPLHDRSASRVVAWKNANCSEITTLFGEFAQKHFTGELVRTRGRAEESTLED